MGRWSCQNPRVSTVLFRLRRDEQTSKQLTFIIFMHKGEVNFTINTVNGGSSQSKKSVWMISIDAWCRESVKATVSLLLACFNT